MTKVLSPQKQRSHFQNSECDHHTKNHRQDKHKPDDALRILHHRKPPFQRDSGKMQFVKFQQNLALPTT